MRIRNKGAAFAVMAVFMLSAAACGKKEEAPVETAPPAEETSGIEPSEEVSSETVSGEETTEEETLETVFFDNLTKEPHFGLITETGFCNYEIAAGEICEGFNWKYTLKINNLERGMIPWDFGGGSCRMYYAVNDDDKFVMTFGTIEEMRNIKHPYARCFHPDVFRNASVDELFKRKWMPYLTDNLSGISICEFIEDENAQYIYIFDAKGDKINGKNAKSYTVLINNKDGSGAFWASVAGTGKYFNDDELLRIIKSVNMSLEEPSTGLGVYYEKDAGNGRSDYYLYYRNNSDPSKSSELVVEGFERDKFVEFRADGEQYYVLLLSKDNIDSNPLVIDFNIDTNIEFLRSLELIRKTWQ